MRKTPQGWKAIDVVIDGISYVKSYHDDFGAQIDQQGLDAVITRLEKGEKPSDISKTVEEAVVRHRGRGGRRGSEFRAPPAFEIGAGGGWTLARAWLADFRDRAPGARRRHAEVQGCGARACEVDCSGITASDSAGLTVLLDWLALAKRDGRSLRYLNLPEGLLAIAQDQRGRRVAAEGSLTDLLAAWAADPASVDPTACG